MSYEVRVAPAAEREIKRLSDKVQGGVLDRLARLAEDPRPRGCEKLKGIVGHELYRIRVAGSYRILYEVRASLLRVLVVRVADRKEVYRRLDELARLLE